MGATSVKELTVVSNNIRPVIEAALEESGGLLRLLPCWVPRSFLQPGKRLKLAPQDLYAFGLDRGGIDERWFASTTPAANENREPDEGLSYIFHGSTRVKLIDAIEEMGSKGSDVCYGCHGGRSWYRISYPYPRHAWPTMSPSAPDWAKDRATTSDARFLEGVKTPEEKK